MPLSSSSLGAITTAIGMAASMVGTMLPQVERKTDISRYNLLGDFKQAGKYNSLFAGYEFDEVSQTKTERSDVAKGLMEFGGYGITAGELMGKSDFVIGKSAEININSADDLLKEPNLFEGGGMMKDAG